MSWSAFESAQTPATFRALFPEFTGASDALIQSRIDMAREVTPADIWGDLLYQGIAFETAHLLTQLPAAQDMRRKSDGGSVYGDRRQMLGVVVSSGFRVAGLP